MNDRSTKKSSLRKVFAWSAVLAAGILLDWPDRQIGMALAWGVLLSGIVQLAAPYAPFPPEMAKNTDVLEIIRTWQFRKNRYSSS